MVYLLDAAITRVATTQPAARTFPYFGRSSNPGQRAVRSAMTAVTRFCALRCLRSLGISAWAGAVALWASAGQPGQQAPSDTCMPAANARAGASRSLRVMAIPGREDYSFVD